MITRIIEWSLANRLLVLLGTLLLMTAGLFSVRHIPLDAIPDLSDVQVIVKTSYPGQSPRLVEDQVTYPLTTAMMAVPGAKAVRGYSFFGDSYVYVLFDDAVDLYWARSRVQEYLTQAAAKLPVGVKPELGPDATGVGWIYEYALIDKTGRHDLSQLRSLQDWFLKYELRSVPNVAEVASVGGMVKQYQVVVDPDKLRSLRIPLSQVIEAIRNGNRESGGSVIEMGEAEYMIRATGYLKTLDDFRQIPLASDGEGTPVTLGSVARIQVGPQIRRGIAELNGQGEVAGGIVVMRSGKNVLDTIQAVKEKLETLKSGLPKGVEIVPVYDRAPLIERSIATLAEKLIQEFVVVALVCFAFLLHSRSALVAIVTLPLGVLAAFIVMRVQGINANIMSLGGIAIAIGAMVDASIVMVENAHKHIEGWRRHHPGEEPSSSDYHRLITAAAVEVGPALFFSLLIITLSFLPVLALEAQEGRLFGPLAYTKTYAMAAAAGLSITLVPVLMAWFIRGGIRAESDNPLSRKLIAGYRPWIEKTLRHPKRVIIGALALTVLTALPAWKLGTEFMPALDEGDLLYMPTTLPGVSITKVGEILQQSDRIIASFPEVESVFGKAGRAETATDPAPLEMLETTVRLKPRSEWRDGMTPEKLIEELDRAVNIPGLSNVWVQPVRARIDMLSTGIKSPLGVKISGPDVAVLEKLGERIEGLLQNVPGTSSVYAEKLSGGRYIDVDIKRREAARLGLNVSDVQEIVATAVGGENISETVEGNERYPVNLRYPRELRDSMEALRAVPIVTERGQVIPLGSVADVRVADGPAMLRSENARPSLWVYVDIRDRDLGSVAEDARRLVNKEIVLPPGYSIAWSGQYEYFERASARLAYVVPVTLLVIFMLLYLAFRSVTNAMLIMASLPFALIGGFWLLLALGHHLSIASAVGFIALAGLAAEFGVVMLLYIEQAVSERVAAGKMNTRADLVDAIIHGAVLRVRPKAMTAAVIIGGLLPAMIGSGTGSSVMQRIAAPMVGGMISAPLLSMFVLPALYLLIKSRQLED
ncbi:MAG: CusA/CzcA family heavy metal efflux transporter [Paucimonas sp.]|nr:CusA/CzcA family heavy metal efflux transporter [Paucimonas sp.]